MTGFSADWLALREPIDHAARERSAAALDLQALSVRLRGDRSELRVLDLACGSGANLRELAPRLGGTQRWLLVDNDPALLAALPTAMSEWAHAHGFGWRNDAGRLSIEGAGWEAEVQLRCIDLASAMDTVPFADAHLVTASALLDLVSDTWLEALVVHTRAAACAVLFALSVDGHVAWEPGDPDDAEVHRLFTAHQRRDKGFGDSLGCEAAARAVVRFEASGFRTVRAQSDWQIDAAHGSRAIAMLSAMAQGIAAAALEQHPAAHALVGGWKARRLALAGRSSLRVGHVDLFAMLP
ncbi:MAG: class I SAM-dependent methyltransferase [Variovorax sp.]